MDPPQVTLYHRTPVRYVCTNTSVCSVPPQASIIKSNVIQSHPFHFWTREGPWRGLIQAGYFFSFLLTLSSSAGGFVMSGRLLVHFLFTEQTPSWMAKMHITPFPPTSSCVHAPSSKASPFRFSCEHLFPSQPTFPSIGIVHIHTCTLASFLPSFL